MLNSQQKRRLGVSFYIHFPYCLYKCHYCDFNSHAFDKHKIPFEDYFKSLNAEWILRQQTFQDSGRHFLEPGQPVTSIFFGGGTPSLMPPQQVARLIEMVGKNFSISSDTEITLEANPKTVTKESLKGFKQAGINRISIGVQSLHDAYLAKFGRIHTAHDALKTLENVADAGFVSWNADLIFGFPNQTLREWEMDLDQLISFSPPHLSCYSLTVEEGTIFAAQVNNNPELMPSSDLQADLFLVTEKILKKVGLKKYETSNFSRPGFECLHNLTYWNYQPYVGLGAGAVTFLPSLHWGEGHPSILDGLRGSEIFGYRTTNFKSPQKYMDSVSDGTTWYDEEEIPYQVAAGEAMMMGLRKIDGIDNEIFAKIFGQKVEDIFPDQLIQARNDGLLCARQIALTKKGHLFANEVMRRFL